ncbi:MAG: Fic family protein [Tomitella sp.]|nr:Fic family protein [Tomitella sp.]
MTEYLDREDVLYAGSAAVGHILDVADHGLIDAAVARPRATVFGVDAYPDDWRKAAALLQSLVRNHALIDGNKRTSWAAAWTFLHINDHPLDPGFDVDAAEVFMNAAATDGGLTVDELAARLESFAASEQ